MIRKAIIGAVALVALMAAPAAAQYAVVTVTPTQVSSGGVVSVTGTMCPANSEVNIYLVAGDQTALASKAAPAPEGGVLVGTLTADASGSFSTSFTIPAGTAPGVYTVVTTCGDFTDATLIEVMGDQTTRPTTPGTTPTGNNGGGGSSGGGGNLPRTGSNLNGLGLMGAGLLTVGGLVLVATRKRQQRSSSLAG